jgi:hypothetical protein
LWIGDVLYMFLLKRYRIHPPKRAVMADQIVITEKTSQAKDVRAAVYGDILPAEGHLFDLLEPENVVPAWKVGRRYFCGPKAFTTLARQRAEIKPPSLKPFATHCALQSE